MNIPTLNLYLTTKGYKAKIGKKARREIAFLPFIAFLPNIAYR